MQEITQKPILHIFACCNDRTGKPKPSCGPKITPEIVKQVKHWIIQQGLAGKVVITKTGCQGFCNPIGGIACAFPSGRYVKGLQSVEDLKQFVTEEMDKLDLKSA